MNKEEFLKAISEIPKSETKSCISAYNSINVEDLANAIDRFKIVPSYNDLLKENTNLKQALSEIREYVKGSYEMATYTKSVSLDKENIEDILQIIDKYMKEDDKN